MSNPWGLTAGQSRVLAMIVEVGSNKLVARKLDLSPRTVENHITNARKRMGLANTIQMAIAWDRQHRKGEDDAQ